MTFTSQDFDSLLSGLLEAYSPSHQERPASEYLAAWMQAAGFDRAYVDDSGSAVGIVGDGPRDIALLGHIDTVPGYIPIKIHEGKLYGRGAVDAKGPLATFVAATALAGRQPGWRIIVIGATEEEAASSKGAHYATTQFTPEMCVIGEPSQWDRLTLGYKGRLLLDYRYQRAVRHTARPEPNAIEHAVTYWNAVQAEAAAINEGRDKAFDQIFTSIRALNSSDDGFCETATMTLGFRLPVDVPPEEFKPRLLARAEGAEITFRGEEVAIRADKHTPLVRAFNNAIRDEGGKPNFVYKTGTSDMNIVAPIWKCPILAYGPGDSALDHTPEEHIILGEYHKGIAVVANVLRSLG
jgi:LysW-gamma-L-lysine carboxypeptidase